MNSVIEILMKLLENFYESYKYFVMDLKEFVEKLIRNFCNFLFSLKFIVFFLNFLQFRFQIFFNFLLIFLANISISFLKFCFRFWKKIMSQIFFNLSFLILTWLSYKFLLVIFLISLKLTLKHNSIGCWTKSDLLHVDSDLSYVGFVSKVALSSLLGIRRYISRGFLLMIMKRVEVKGKTVLL